MGGSGRFKDDAGFKKVAERLMSEIMKRDQEDGDKLAKGIQLAIDKKVGWGTLGTWLGKGRFIQGFLGKTLGETKRYGQPMKTHDFPISMHSKSRNV